MMLMTVPVFIAPLVSHRLLSTGGLSSARVLALVALACLTLGGRWAVGDPAGRVTDRSSGTPRRSRPAKA